MRGSLLWDAKITLRITGLPEILGRDYGIEKAYWGPSFLNKTEDRTKEIWHKKGKVSNTYNNEDLALNGTTELTTLVLHLKRIFELPQLIPKINWN